jgi:hypothetical protein
MLGLKTINRSTKMARSLSNRAGNPANGAKRPRLGHIQVAVRRSFVAADGRPLMIRDLLVRAFPRATEHKHWMRKSVHRALPKFAIPIGRLERRGRPIIWMPNAEICRLVATQLPKPPKM